MAPPRNNDRPNSSGHTGTIPKSKVRNNCNVPQEAVTPTRRDLASNLVSTSLDWVPVSEYNTRTNQNHNQSRKPSNNTSDHDFNDLDNSLAFESGFGRFVPVRPQPRVLPLNVQNRENPDQHDDGHNSSMSTYSLHPYSHSMHNGLNSHSNHAAAAVMIVNPTTPNAVAGNFNPQGNSQVYNSSSNQNRNNLTRNLNTSRNNFEGNSSSNNNSSQASSSRSGNKAVNLINNMYEQQGSSSNLHENNPASQRESARVLGEALVAACPDASAVERRLGQIREYIRVTSSLVDTMRNSEDEAYIEHTKEEYDDLVEMVMKLKESEDRLVKIMESDEPNNLEPMEDLLLEHEKYIMSKERPLHTDEHNGINTNETNMTDCNTNLKKVTNIENEQINKSFHTDCPIEVSEEIKENQLNETTENPNKNKQEMNGGIEIIEIENDAEIKNQSDNDENQSTITPEIKEKNKISAEELQKIILRQNILSCVEKAALIEELKAKTKNDEQDVVVRPLSVQSNGSAYSENELWQNEIKNKMEVSSQRLVALKQQQQRLLKYQAEAKMQLDEINRQQAQEIEPSTSNENFSDMQQQQVSHHRQLKRGPLNQVGVATTLAHSSDGHDAGTNSNLDHEGVDDRYNRPGNHVSSEEAGGRDSDEEEGMLSERGRQLQMKLRELQLKKQHMENLVSEFQKLQMDQQIESARNTYSSSGEESADEEPARKCNNSEGNMKNEDPFKLMEIKAIKAALQKTKDLMRSVENYESEQIAVQDEPYQGPSHSGHNLNDNKSSDGGGSAGGWSNEGSVCRVRNSLPQRRKYTNEQHRHHQGHDMNIASLQELAQQLRMETEKIMGERARLKDVVANKAMTKHKKVNEEKPRTSSGAVGPAERRQLELKALLAQKQKELEALINNEKTIVNSDSPKVRQTSNAGSLANQSYNSEPEESTSHQGHIMMNSQNNPRDTDSFRAGGDTGLVCRSLHNLSSQVGSVYCSDSDSASRTKTNQRNRLRRKQQPERQTDDNSQVGNSNQNLRHEPRVDTSNVNMTPPIQHTNNGDIPMNMQYPHMPPPNWGNNKSNQDMRTNQFTQNSHSQTMDRLLGTPPLSFPPSMPPMMMPYGSMGGCGCGCGVWGVWCWQQLLLHQRDILQLRDQIAHLEERWRAETASNILNNQVPPGNRANNYWDNFRSYSRQNLLSSSKPGCPAPPKRNRPRSRGPPPPGPPPPGPPSRGPPPPEPDVTAAVAPALRYLNATARDVPEIVHAHNNNSTTSYNINSATKNKASTKLPAKNSPHRANRALDYTQTTNINIASSSTAVPAPNPNLASAANDKSTSKLFDLLRENVYSEVTALIGVNESHPDFLIQLFRELQSVSSDPLRQRVLYSIRSLLSQTDNLNGASTHDDTIEAVSTTNDGQYSHNNSNNQHNDLNHRIQIDNGIIHFLLLKSEEICTMELLDTLASLILNSSIEGSPQLTKQNILDILVKYEGMRVCDVSNDIISRLPHVMTDNEAVESNQHNSEVNESSALQDVAGSLNLLNQNEQQFHQTNCPYENWHMDIDKNHQQPSSSRSEAKMDLINCSEMNDGDLAEADQTCRGDIEEHDNSRDELVTNSDTLPDVVETEEATPTEAEAEWLGLDRVPTRLHHMEDTSEKQKD